MVEISQSLKPIGEEMIIALERDVEAGIQCYQQLESNFIYWRVEIRVEGEILHAQMFYNGNEARSFARELRDLSSKGIISLEEVKLALT
ncbi:MAG: hypothetical protein ACXAEU_07315 [Candidatus Hodarchaeales archaeon]